MKILIGVCGIGKGHCIREYEISKELIKRGHEVRILTYNEGVNFFESTGIKTYNVYVPIILFKNEKIDIVDCFKRNFLKFIPGIIKDKKIFNLLIKDNFIPDVCVSDYEPVTARISYKLKIPLINIDQHSKFMYMKEESINGYSCTEEKRRLKLFFPKSDKKYVVSFYELPKSILPNNVEIVYPIIRNDLKKIQKNVKNKKTIVVYLSKYINIPIKQKMEDLIKVFNQFPKYKFIVFSTEYYNKQYRNKNNVEFRKNDRKEFVKELKDAFCVISTAGHTLISEALYCNIPIFVVPLPTFDQNYCGQFINENKIGYSSDEITYYNLSKFLKNIEIYKENIKKCNKLVKKTDSLNYLVDKIEEYDKNKQKCYIDDEKTNVEYKKKQ